MGTDAKPSATGMPSWQQAPFDRFFDYSGQVHGLLHLTISGIEWLSTSDKRVAALQKVHAVTNPYNPDTGEGTPPAEQIAELEAAREEAAFAQAEIETDFLKLRAHSLVDEWGALEVLVDDLLVAWFTNSPALLSKRETAKLRIPLGEFQQLDDEERLRFLVQELARDRKADLKAGVTRFEVLLGAIDLDGEVRGSLKRDVFEAHQVRNAIVHRRGRADRRLLAACPWMPIEIGEHVPLHEANHVRYEVGILSYAVVVFNRARSKNGLPPIDVPAYETNSDSAESSAGPEV
jgi:hypothetical protein